MPLKSADEINVLSYGLQSFVTMLQLSATQIIFWAALYDIVGNAQSFLSMQTLCSASCKEGVEEIKCAIII